MNKKDKRKFTAAIKVKVALEALRGQSILAEIAKSYELHPSQILDWKKIRSERAEELFTTKGEKIVTSSDASSVRYFRFSHYLS